ncbi:MAG: hypothetical protein RJA44_2067 [Pseudomonadota bacterium]
MKQTAVLRAFLHHATGTITHLVADPATGCAAIIDSVLDLDPYSGAISTASADRLLAQVRAEGWQIDWHLETHAHAEHLSAAAYLQQRLGGQVAAGAGLCELADPALALLLDDAGARQPEHQIGSLTFHHLFADGDVFAIGALRAEVLRTPGHTPACVSYRVGSDVFVGDLLLTGGGALHGDARRQQDSLRRVLDLPPRTRLHPGHADAVTGRIWQRSVAAQRTLRGVLRSDPG